MKMKEVVPEDVEFLVRLVQFLTPRQRNHFIKTMNRQQMKVLEVACFNLATNHRGLSKAQQTVLTKFKRQIEIIASKEYKLEDKRKIAKRGGFWGAVLPILATLATSFLTK